MNAPWASGPALRPGRRSSRLPAQQWVTETRDPEADAGRRFREGLRAVDGRAAITAARWSTTCRKSPGIPSPKDVLGYHIGAPRKLTYYADILKYYRALGGGHAARARSRPSASPTKTASWSSSGSRPKRTSRTCSRTATTSRRLADPRGLTEAQIKQLIANDQAALSPDGRPAQRRDGPVRNADGAGLSAGRRRRRRSSRRSATTSTSR